MGERTTSYVLAGVAGAAALAVLVAISVGVWLWRGGWDAAASSPVSRLAYWPVRISLVGQVERGAAKVGAPPALDGRRTILGFRQYDAACGQCHGTPDEPRTVWAKAMNPAPPDLTETGGRWSDKELFWLICHGVKMTGMPAFGVRRTDDEIWDLALFVSGLPKLSAQDYERMRADYGPAPRAFDLTPNATCLTTR